MASNMLAAISILHHFTIMFEDYHKPSIPPFLFPFALYRSYGQKLDSHGAQTPQFGVGHGGGLPSDWAMLFLNSEFEVLEKSIPVPDACRCLGAPERPPWCWWLVVVGAVSGNHVLMQVLKSCVLWHPADDQCANCTWLLMTWCVSMMSMWQRVAFNGKSLVPLQACVFPLTLILRLMVVFSVLPEPECQVLSLLGVPQRAWLFSRAFSGRFQAGQESPQPIP